MYLVLSVGYTLGNSYSQIIYFLKSIMNAAELLVNSLSPDPNIRKQAASALENAAIVNFPAYLQLLCQELANEQQVSHVRVAAGVALKNSLVAKELPKRLQLHQRWIALDLSLKQAVKHLVLQTLSTTDGLVGTTLAQIIASVASIELSRNEWPELLQILLQNVTNINSTPSLKKATLESIGFICEDIDPTVLSSKSNEILTAVVQGARKEEPNALVRKAAINALYNSLSFIKGNFDKELERNYIMQVVCEATQSKDDPVGIAAFECLVGIMMTYYDYMMSYMNQGLFQMTIESMKHANEKIALQAIEFWSSVCDEEVERQIDREEGNDQITIFYFARAALPHVLPTLLTLLTLRISEEDEDDWSVSKASATCLSLFANCVQDELIDSNGTIFKFIQQNISSQDWRKRDAALMAFASIIDGPNPSLLEPYTKELMPICIKMMTDTSIAVRDTAAWTLGRICDLTYHLIDPNIISDIMIAILNGLKDEPRVSSHCACAVIHLATNLGSQDDETQTNALSPYFQNCVTQLVIAAQRNDADENNLASISYQAVSALITYSARDSFELIFQLAGSLLTTLEETITLQAQKVGFDDTLRITDTQSHLCTVLHSIVKRLGDHCKGLLDRSMRIFLQILSSGSSSRAVSLFEDALMTIGSLIEETEQEFAPWLNHFFPILCHGIQQHSESLLCSISISIVGDLSRAFERQFVPFCETLMKHLSEAFHDSIIDRSVKPHILAAFGDIALAIGSQFHPYLQGVMQLLERESVVTVSHDSLDDVDYLNELRENILGCYICILQGLKGDGTVEAIWPFAPHILQFIMIVSMDNTRTENVARQAISLLGDICSEFGSKLKMRLQEPWIKSFVKEYRKGEQYSESTMNAANWTYKLLMQLV